MYICILMLYLMGNTKMTDTLAHINITQIKPLDP